ncbi:hypothetical protein [Burkholderia sp. BCC0397]|uniref:hypothetical protein n=1 Tax=Burkholderia sp. BCC0397 TaxID=486876 RepID=UPI00158E9B45|nr:hypothetical protein [Burkholderia sp. BCC0397]
MKHRHAWQVLSWRCAWALDQLRAAHLVVAGLLALWASLIIAIDYPLLRETRQMAMQLASIPEPAQEQSTAAKTQPPNAAKEFAATLPEFDAYPDELRELNTLADKSGVVVARVDYRYDPLKALPIKRLVMRMDIKGQDLQQRRFLQVMLNTFPNLSIARLAYTKSTDGSLNVDQMLEIHLYYQLKAAP